MSNVQDIAQLIVDKLINKLMTNVNRECVYVTELSKCAYYIYWLYNKSPIEHRINNFIIEGTLMHFVIEKIVKKLIEEGAVSPEHVKSEIDVEKEFNGITIKGRVDLIINDTIVEFKFTHNPRLIYGLPKVWHIAQVNLYMWMTGLRKGLIIYIHLPSLNVKMWKVSYDDELVSNRLSKVNDVMIAKHGKEVEKEMFGCDICPIYAQCRFARIDMFS